MSATAFRPSVDAIRVADLMRRRDAERLIAIRSEVRLMSRRARRLRAVCARLQPLLDQLEGGLREEKLDALRRGERGRADRIEREMDGLHETFTTLASAIVEDMMRG
jgi:hypothetical protein